MSLDSQWWVRIRLKSFSDVAYAVRALRRSPGSSTLVIATLALGLGGEYVIVHAGPTRVLLRPLPYRDPDRLVMFGKPADPQTRVTAPLSWMRNNRPQPLGNRNRFIFREPAIPVPGREFLSQEIGLIATSYNLFSTLGVSPLLGRDFAQSDQAPGTQRVAILSHAAWQDMYGGDPAILGKPIKVSGTPLQVIGVMRPNFAFPTVDSHAQIWTPLLATEKDKTLNYATPSYRVIARLNQGNPAQTAEAELSAIQQQLAKAYADPLLQADHSAVRVQRYGDFLVAPRFALFVLALAVAAVWLIGCINVANLMLARATRRQQEVAIRLALGASRTRILLQFLAESLILSATGALLGLGLSAGALRLFGHALQSELNFGPQLRLRPEVVAALAGLTLSTAVVFGLGPAMASVRAGARQGLRQSAMRASSPGHQIRIRNLLVIGEFGLSLALLMSCGLLLRTLYALRHVPLGFQPDHVVVVSMKIPAYRFQQRNLTTDLYQPLLDQVHRLLGTEVASLASSMPLESSRLQLEMYISNGSVDGESRRVESFLRVVSPEFQKVIGLRLLRGRYFTHEDTTGSQPVVVVNRAFARLYWHTDDVTGRSLMSFGNSKPAVVVGVIDDLRQDAVSKSPQPEIQISLLQMAPGIPSIRLARLPQWTWLCARGVSRRPWRPNCDGCFKMPAPSFGEPVSPRWRVLFQTRLVIRSSRPACLKSSRVRRF